MNKLKGFKDYYPEDYIKRDKLISSMKDVSFEFGYIPYDGPILEDRSLFELKSGDNILEEIYAFKDNGGKSIVLRPEMTPTLARMLSKRSQSMRKPIRWFSIPLVFRYEKPQKGRSREFIQYNADIIGENSILAEIEIIDLSMSMLENIGFDRNDFDILVNDRKFICDYISSFTSNVSEVLYVIDHKDKITDIDFRERLQHIIGNEKKVNSFIAFLEKYDFSKSDDLSNLFKLSKNFNLKLSFSPYLVRGFDYYTGIVFEIWDKKRKIKRSIFGGGRYDNLISNMGGENISAVGVGASDTIFFALMNEYDKHIDVDIKYDYFISTFPKMKYDIYYDVASRLRKKGYSVLFNLNSSWSLTKQLEYALECNVKNFIIIGEKEMKDGNVTVKDLLHTKENIIKLNDL